MQDLDPLVQRAFSGKRRVRFVFAALLAVMLLACGRKGAPTLRSFEKPAKPSLVSAIHREDAIILTWEFPKDKEETIARFVVFESSGGGVERKLTVPSSQRSLRITDFQEGGTYRYRIAARSLTGVLSDASAPFSVVPLSTPQPPENISFSVTDDTVLLHWKECEKGVLYNVFRTFAQGVYGLEPLNPRPLTDASFRDVLYLDKKVYYTVRSLHNTTTRDEGPPSGEIEVNPYEFTPSAPQDVGYFAAPDRVFLFWKPAAERWVTEYRVYRKVGDKYTLLGTTEIPSFVDDEKPLTERDYRITAVGLKKEGQATEIHGILYSPKEETDMP